MCCRYQLKQESITLLIRDLLLNNAFTNKPFQEDNIKRLSSAKTGEIFPTDTAPIFSLDRSNQINLHLLKWGFPTFKHPSVVMNGRAETIDHKPMFKNTKKCVVLANGFFEWKKSTSSNKKEKHFITNSRGSFYMAGLYQQDHFLIITTQSSPSMKSIHDRMPVIFDAQLALSWLSNQVFANLNPYEGELIIKKIEPPSERFEQLSFF
jgi:putative SOS response-associated peptidase YedK